MLVQNFVHEFIELCIVRSVYQSAGASNLRNGKKSSVMIGMPSRR
jgi:hypothetical protein